MNARQFLRQMKTLLLAEEWGSSGNVVFPSGSVLVSAAPNEIAMKVLRPPWCLLRCGSFRADANDPTYGEQDFEAIVATSVPGDALGEAALLGANRQTDKSEGAGLLRIEEKVYSVLSRLSESSGIIVTLAASGAVQASQLAGNAYETVRGYRFSGWIGTAPSFPAPTQFEATVSGTVSLSWVVPPSRYDRDKVTLRRIAGSTPVTSPTAGTGVTLSGDLATSVVDSPGSGTWSYSLFGEYDDNGDGTADSYGTPETRTEVVA